MANHLGGMSGNAVPSRRPSTRSLALSAFSLLVASIGCGIPSGSSPEEVGGSKAAAEAGKNYGESLQRGIDRGKKDKTLGDLRGASRIINQFLLDHSSYPEAGSCSDLTRALSDYRGLHLSPTDPWGTPYECRSSRDGYSLRSAGEDRELGTGDDILVEEGSP